MYEIKSEKRTGKHWDGSERTYFVWCIYEEGSIRPLITFGEQATPGFVKLVFNFLQVE